MHQATIRCTSNKCEWDTWDVHQRYPQSYNVPVLRSCDAAVLLLEDAVYRGESHLPQCSCNPPAQHLHDRSGMRRVEQFEVQSNQCEKPANNTQLAATNVRVRETGAGGGGETIAQILQAAANNGSHGAVRYR